ncbi:MAG TPA: protein kinase [Solirubrobacteraceae bacterium]|nr:protein kinase [Solirubrobacteraceae bacterium]
MTPSIPHMESGTILGGYRIDGVAGQGGMGVVYRATQLGLDRPVALKVIASELADNVDFRNRFKSESQLAASIDHPNVVPVYEAGEADGVLYLAMRFVEGTDLRSLVDASGGGLTPERAVRIVWQVGAALDAAHRRGLVHRDVKPPNVLIAQEGEEHAYLTDFGLTKHAASAGGITRTGQFVGTPDFSAPEQIRGEQADARADVYALGCVLFHALTGRVPFPRDSELAKMYAHLSDPAPAASPLNPAVPAALDAVVGTAMAKEPPERYASAGDLARAAWAALQGEPAPAPAGSVATGEAAKAAQRAPDTPAPRTPMPSGAATPPPGGASTAAPPAEPGPAPESKPGGGPASWPKGRRVALLVALPVLLAVALAVAALGAAGVLGGDDGKEAIADVTATPTATATSTAEAEEPDGATGAGTPQVAATIPVGDGPDGITADGETVFVSHAREGTLQAIDATTDELSGDAVEVGSNPDQIAAGKGTVWVVDASSSQLQRLQSEPELQATARIPVGKDAQGISLGPQLAWVANTGEDTVQRVDRASATAVGDPIGVGDHPIGIFVGSKVWVTNFSDGTLSQIDIATAQVEGDALPVGEGARGVVEGLGGVWVSNLKDDTVVRVDPTTFEVVATINVGREPKDIVAAHGSIWVVNSKSNTVTRIDPETDRVVGGPIPVGQNPIGLAASRDALWVTNFRDDTVSRIDPATS